MAKSSLALLVKDGKTVSPRNMDAMQRHSMSARDRKIIKAPEIGKAPKYFDENQSAIWREVVATMPWLRENHRITVELYVAMIAKFRTEPDRFSAKDAGILMKCADRLGGNPISDQFFATNDGDAPQDEFFDG